MGTFLLILIPLLVGGAILLAIYAVTQLKSEVPSEDREYMDPLPPLLRM
ncbi:MAG: type II secretion system F family protein, partial [Rhodoferax sp.]|nr:type II secretion system F family protein [Rhodoferax sp.]